jgi:hypothetical protein
MLAGKPGKGTGYQNQQENELSDVKNLSPNGC